MEFSRYWVQRTEQFNKTKPHEVQTLHKDSKGVVIGKGGVNVRELQVKCSRCSVLNTSKLLVQSLYDF